MAEAEVTREVTGVELTLTLDEAQQLRALLGQTGVGTVGNAFDAISDALDAHHIEYTPYKVEVDEGWNSIELKEYYK